MILLSVDAYNHVDNFVNMPFLASLAMSNEENIEKSKDSKKDLSPATPPSMGKDWGSGFGAGRTKLFDSPDDFDIYCDRERGINYIFHGCDLNCTIDHLEYDPETQRITVHTNDRQQLDLGAKIQWLVRPYIAKEQDLFIIQTQNGEVVDGLEVHLKIKDPEVQKTLN